MSLKNLDPMFGIPVSDIRLGLSLRKRKAEDRAHILEGLRKGIGRLLTRLLPLFGKLHY